MSRFVVVLIVALVFQSARADTVNPPLALWRVIKKGLEESGQRFFDERVKDALIPGGVNGVRGLRGKVVSIDWELRRSILRLSMENDSAADVTLEVSAGVPLTGIEEGKSVLFQGVATKFTRDPFMLTFEIGGSDCFVEIEKPPSSKKR